VPSLIHLLGRTVGCRRTAILARVLHALEKPASEQLIQVGAQVILLPLTLIDDD